jgi:hypothetical protein
MSLCRYTPTKPSITTSYPTTSGKPNGQASTASLIPKYPPYGTPSHASSSLPSFGPSSSRQCNGDLVRTQLPLCSHKALIALGFKASPFFRIDQPVSQVVEGPGHPAVHLSCLRLTPSSESTGNHDRRQATISFTLTTDQQAKLMSERCRSIYPMCFYLLTCKFSARNISCVCIARRPPTIHRADFERPQTSVQ